jgi:hypothetical protein
VKWLTPALSFQLQRAVVQAGLGKNQDLIYKITRAKGPRVMAQVVKHLAWLASMKPTKQNKQKQKQKTYQNFMPIK